MGLYDDKEDQDDDVIKRRGQEGKQDVFSVPLVHQVKVEWFDCESVNNNNNLQAKGSRADTYRQFLRPAMQNNTNLVVVTQVLFLAFGEIILGIVG